MGICWSLGACPWRGQKDPNPFSSFPLWHCGHEVNGFAIPQTPAKMCCPSQLPLPLPPTHNTGIVVMVLTNPVMNWNLQNCEPEKNLFSLLVLGIEPSASQRLDRYCTTDLYPQPNLFILFGRIVLCSSGCPGTHNPPASVSQGWDHRRVLPCLTTKPIMFKS
jgi:hypothetical protein